ncbi:transposase [Streptomyces sp. SJ1-7]|nr:transposase [Streptomyces sp. SJ1-7]
MVTRTRHHPPHRPQRSRALATAGSPPRWTVERTMAWLAGCRRLHRRYEPTCPRARRQQRFQHRPLPVREISPTHGP